MTSFKIEDFTQEELDMLNEHIFEEFSALFDIIGRDRIKECLDEHRGRTLFNTDTIIFEFPFEALAAIGAIRKKKHGKNDKAKTVTEPTHEP